MKSALVVQPMEIAAAAEPPRKAAKECDGLSLTALSLFVAFLWALAALREPPLPCGATARSGLCSPIENPKPKIQNPKDRNLIEHLSLICGGSPGAWRWDERMHEEAYTNGVEAWVYALKGEYKPWSELQPRDLDAYDLIVLNTNPEALSFYRRLLRGVTGRRAKIIGLYEGELALLHQLWKSWQQVADLCDMVIAINTHGVGLIQSLTSSPVHYVGIPYPVDGVKGHRVPAGERRREILLCAPLLARPLDYLAARALGLPMYGYEKSISRRPKEMLKHRTSDKLHYVHQARELYADPSMEVLPQTHLGGFFKRAAGSLLWMNLDPRYTWGRYVLDAAALGMPIITTRETGHGPRLFPDLTVETPYHLDRARQLGERLLEEPGFYQEAVQYATDGLDWYRPERTVERLRGALGI